MEHRLPAGVPEADALLSAAGKRRELGHRRQHRGGGATAGMDPELNLPLGVKLPVLPGSKPVFTRAKLGEKLHRPSCFFDLGDPYSQRLPTEYHSLHDPHLQAFHSRTRNLQRLQRGGYVTSDGQVVCSLKEFNEYRRYRTVLRQEAKQTFQREKERLRQQLDEFKDVFKLPGAVDTSCLAERLLLQPHKPPCPPPPQRTKTSLQLRGGRRAKAASGKSQSYCPAEPGQEGAELPRRVSADAADGVFKAAREQEAAAEAQELEALAQTVVQEVLEGVKAARGRSVCNFRRAARGISGSTGGTQPSQTSPTDGRQGVGLVAKELVAAELESLGKRLPSSTAKASEPGPAARRTEQPVAGGTTRAGKPKGQSCTYCEILELPRGIGSNQRPQPWQTPFSRQGVEEGQAFPRAPEQQRLEAREGAAVPVSQALPNASAAHDLPRWSRTGATESIRNAVSSVEQRRAEWTGNGRTIGPESLGTVKKVLEREMKAEPVAVAKSVAVRTVASHIVASVLQRVCQQGPAPTPGRNFGRFVTKPPTPRAGQQSCAAEDSLPSPGPQFARQPVPPAGPQPPARTGAGQRAVRVTPAPGQPPLPVSDTRALVGRLVDDVLSRCVPREL